MSDTPSKIRASDVERERVAKRMQTASAEGRLTLEETQQRLGAVYAAKYLDDLGKLTADLPPEQHVSGRFPSPLLIHAAVVAVIVVAIIAHWIVSGAMFFRPVRPLSWLGLSLAVHAAFRAYRRPVPYWFHAVRPAPIFLRDPDSGSRDRVVPPTAITASPGVHGPGAFVGPGTRWDSA